MVLSWLETLISDHHLWTYMNHEYIGVAKKLVLPFQFREIINQQMEDDIFRPTKWRETVRSGRSGSVSRNPSKALLGTDLFPTHNGVVSARTAAARLSLVPCRAAQSQLQMEKTSQKTCRFFLVGTSQAPGVQLQHQGWNMLELTPFVVHQRQQNHGTPYCSCWSGSNFHNLGRWWNHNCPMST